MNTEQLKVVRNEAANRFEIRLDEGLAQVEYRILADRIAFLHTEVPVEAEGKGVAGKLAKTALDYAREHGMIVLPYCPYIAAYIKKHPEYQDLVGSLDR